MHAQVVGGELRIERGEGHRRVAVKGGRAVGGELDGAGKPGPRIGDGMNAGKLNLIASCTESKLAVLKVAGGMAEACLKFQVGGAGVDTKLSHINERGGVNDGSLDAGERLIVRGTVSNGHGAVALGIPQCAAELGIGGEHALDRHGIGIGASSQSQGAIDGKVRDAGGDARLVVAGQQRLAADPNGGPGEVGVNLVVDGGAGGRGSRGEIAERFAFHLKVVRRQVGVQGV